MFIVTYVTILLLLLVVNYCAANQKSDQVPIILENYCLTYECDMDNMNWTIVLRACLCLDEIAGKIATSNEFSSPCHSAQFPGYKSACKKGVSKKP